MFAELLTYFKNTKLFMHTLQSFIKKKEKKINNVRQYNPKNHIYYPARTRTMHHVYVREKRTPIFSVSPLSQARARPHCTHNIVIARALDFPASSARAPLIQILHAIQLFHCACAGDTVCRGDSPFRGGGGDVDGMSLLLLKCCIHIQRLV